MGNVTTDDQDKTTATQKFLFACLLFLCSFLRFRSEPALLLAVLQLS